MPVVIQNDWSYRTQNYMERRKHLPTDCALAALCNEKMYNIDRVRDFDRINGWLMSGKKVNSSQFPDQKTVDERLDRVRRMTERMFKVNLNRAVPPKFKCFASNDPNYIGSEDTMKALLKMEDTPDAARYNARLLDRWNNGTKEDRSSLVQELLDEADHVDLTAWENASADYILDHYEEYARDLSILSGAPILYRSALDEGLIKADPKSARFEAYSDYVDYFDSWFDMKLQLMFVPVGLRFDPTLSDGLLSPEELEKVNPDYAEAVRTADGTIYGLLDLTRTADKTRRNYEAFLKACDENGLDVPASTEEFGNKWEKDFKAFGADLGNAFYEVLYLKEQNKPLPWETEKYRKGKELALSDPDAQKKADAYQAVMQYTEFHKLYGMYKSQDRRYSGLLNREIKNGIGMRLGYRQNEAFSLIAGGAADNIVVSTAQDMDRFAKLDHKKDLSFAVDRETGKAMALRINAVRKFPGLSDCTEYEIREATDEEVESLRAAQYEAFKRELDNIFGDEKTVLHELGKDAAGLVGALRGIRSVCADIDSGKASTAGSADALNVLTVGLGREALRIRNNIMQGAADRLPTDAEGRSLVICDKLTDFALHRCIGIPSGAPEADRQALADEMKQPASLTAEQLRNKLTHVCKVLRSTCVGFRRDSDQFTFLRSCAEHSLQTLKDAEASGIALSDEKVKGEFRSVLTAASDYLRYRKNMETVNGRTQTRIAVCEDLKALGASIGCRTYMPAEKLADSLANCRMDQCRAELKKHPDNADIRRELTNALTDRGNYISRIRNNKGFCDAIRGKSPVLLHGYARTSQGIDRFLSDYKAVQKEAQQKTAAPKAPSL